MRNKLRASISQHEEGFVFSLVEINNALNHHHIVRFRQHISLDEMDDLINDFKEMTAQLEEWKLVLAEDTNE